MRTPDRRSHRPRARLAGLRDDLGHDLGHDLGRGSLGRPATLSAAPAFTSLVLSFLALGIGATVTPFSLVETLLLAPAAQGQVSKALVSLMVRKAAP